MSEDKLNAPKSGRFLLELDIWQSDVTLPPKKLYIWNDHIGSFYRSSLGEDKTIVWSSSAEVRYEVVQTPEQLIVALKGYVKKV